MVANIMVASKNHIKTLNYVCFDDKKQGRAPRKGANLGMKCLSFM
jgi:hypothetical protein